MAFRATPGRTPPGPGPRPGPGLRSGVPSASFPSPQPPMAGPGDIEEEDEEEPAEVSEEWGGLGEAEPTLFHVDQTPYA